ncbi:MAG TPA: transposase, partial [Myxococcales bacterium]
MAQRDLERRIADLRSSEPWTEDEARLVLDACEESGESVAAFARRMGLGAYRLFWWRKRLGQVAPAPAAFVPLVVREATSVSPRQPAAVLVRGSVRIELRTLDADSAAWAAALLRSPEDERACPTCGKERRCVCHERTEVIDLIPAEVVVRVDLREVLACEDCDAEMVRAPMGDKVVAGGAYGSRLVSELVVDKYRDGLPLHREHERLERLGLDMPSSSMADQIACAADLLLPIWRALLARILSSKVMHLDGTSLPVRDKDNAYAVAIGTLWGYVGDDAAAYLYTSTGKKTGQLEGEVGPEDLLAARHGYVVADAAGLFDASFKSGQRIEVGCNMHSRRRFVKALDAGDVRAAVPLAAYKA